MAGLFPHPAHFPDLGPSNCHPFSNVYANRKIETSKLATTLVRHSRRFSKTSQLRSEGNASTILPQIGRTKLVLTENNFKWFALVSLLFWYNKICTHCPRIYESRKYFNLAIQLKSIKAYEICLNIGSSTGYIARGHPEDKFGRTTPNRGSSAAKQSGFEITLQTAYSTNKHTATNGWTPQVSFHFEQTLCLNSNNNWLHSSFPLQRAPPSFQGTAFFFIC